MPRPRRAIRPTRPTPREVLGHVRAEVTERVSAVRTGFASLMPSSATARRELIRTGIAAATISALGLGVAGAMTATSVADSGAAAVTQAQASHHPAFERRTDSTSRSGADRAAGTQGDDGTATGAAAQRATDLAAERQKVTQAGAQAAIDSRNKQLAGDSTTTTQAARELEDEQHSKVLPLKTYRIAAQFGAVGAWARYHTGTDFSAPLGTPIHAIAAGTVVHVGSGGEAGGWAGSYVVIRHEDGYQTLYAHMNPAISVTVGQRVSPGQLIGHVGLTGRTFGAHCHVELYPPGATPGDVYTAVNLFGWLNQPA